MNADICQQIWRYTDERLAELVAAARDAGASHPFLTQWPVEDESLARNILHFAVLHDPEADHQDRLTALRLIYNQVARFPDDIESPSLLAMNVQLLLADRLNSIELLHLLTRLQYQLLGYEPRVSCARGERRKVFGLYKNGEPILAGTTLRYVSPLLQSAFRHISGLSKVNIRALSLQKRHQAAELVMMYFLHGVNKQIKWECRERRMDLQRFCNPTWELLKEGEAELLATDPSQSLLHCLDYEALQLVAHRLNTSDALLTITTPKTDVPAKESRQPCEVVLPVKRLAVIQGSIPPASDANDQLQIQRFKVLQTVQPVVQLPAPDQLYGIQEILTGEFPWASGAIDAILGELRLKRHLGALNCKVRPTLIAGQPGVGKTRFARRLAEELNLAFRAISIGGMDDSRALLGTSRGWSTGQPSSLLDLLLNANSPSAMVLLDEVDKASDRSVNSAPVSSALLGLLEAESARRWFDSFLQTECDLSMVSFILTANSLSRLPTPLLSRCQVVMFNEPSPEHIAAAVPHVLEDLAGEWGLPSGVFKGFESKVCAFGSRSIRELKGALTHALKMDLMTKDHRQWRH
ncbi:AAA family ATPase [Hydrogenophaga sp. R2]|uniref:AAA family ATPase n=1 Tax=Hydrogenophaga sp. R2 TaxID=3132827 RepID=UPI003CF7B296